MNYFLSIETSTEVCSVCLHTDDHVVLELHANESYQHTKVLATLIQSLFEKTNISIDQLVAVGISAGPGSYTGLRVGVSTAKGICYGLDIPLIAVNTLEAIAVGAKHHFPDLDYYISMIDARRMEVYAQVFNKEMQSVGTMESVILGPDSFESLLNSASVGFCGNGMYKFKTIISNSNAVFTEVICDAENLVKIVSNKYHENRYEDLFYFEPTYFKAPNITKSKKNIFV